jgi:hypothetical protein
MSESIGPGDLALCINAGLNHVTGKPVPLKVGETYCIASVQEFSCPCGRSDALLTFTDTGPWCQTRFRIMPKPKAEAKTKKQEIKTPQKVKA